MAEQTITIPASSLDQDTDSIKRWNGLAIDLDPAFAPPGETRFLYRVIVRTDIDPGFQLRLLFNQSSSGQDLVEAWEMALEAVHFEQGEYSVTLPGPDHPTNFSRDESETYAWFPPSSRSADAGVFFFVDLDTAQDLTLRLSFPDTVVDRDASMSVRAGSPSVSVAAEASAVVNQDASVIVRAGSPRVSVSAETVGVQTRDASVSVRAGSPTVSAAAQAEQPTLDPSDLSGESLVGVRYRTRDGDSLDVICWKHYGRQAGAVEAVLEANPGLAGVGPTLPAGWVIGLPELTQPVQEIETLRLWD